MRVVANVGFVLAIKVNRDEIIFAIYLYAVARVIKECHVSGAELFDKLVDGFAHGFAVGVGNKGDVEAEFAKAGSHGLSVINGVGERTVGIGGVADDQG